MVSILEEAFFNAVEGVESMDSCGFANGQLYADLGTQIMPRSQPNLTLLADALRSDIELTSDIREWLANLVAPNGSGEAALMFRKRTKAELGKKLYRKKQFSQIGISQNSLMTAFAGCAVKACQKDI